MTHATEHHAIEHVAATPLLGNDSASLLDIGEGVACLAVATKMGTFDPAVFALIEQAVALVAASGRALVIHHDGRHFSAGANLKLFGTAADRQDWDAIESMLVAGQRAMKALKYAPFPVVAAPFGVALGGGCEIVLHADAVLAHAELTIGLVECSVGLVPAWGGCGEMLDRLQRAGSRKPASDAFRLIGASTIARTWFEATALHFLWRDDGVVEKREELLAAAKTRALDLADRYHPPEAPVFALSGVAGVPAMVAEPRPDATPHDAVVADALARILSGGDRTGQVTEAHLLDLERQEFMRLIRTPETQARIAHTLATGKPLRN